MIFHFNKEGIAHMPFDSLKVAKQIKAARIAKNMTQMQLADEMNVSYQAVSNWERGNSMPDISRLRELCGVLEISVDSLLGGETAAVIDKVTDHTEGNPTEITAEELGVVAPILPPNEVQQLSDSIVKKTDSVDFETVLALAPFMDEETLGYLADKITETDIFGLKALAPFLSKDRLDRLAEEIAEVDTHELAGLAPFLSEETLDRMAEKIMEIDTAGLARLAPFLETETVDRLTEKISETDISSMIRLAPFMSENALDRLADKMEAVDLHALPSLAPFLKQSTLKRIVEKYFGEGDYEMLKKIAPFLE